MRNSFSIRKNNTKLVIKPFQVTHGLIKSTGYVIDKIAYISDCNDLSIVNMKIFQNLKHLVIDCLRIKKSPVHFNLDDALYVHKLLMPKKTVMRKVCQ